MFVDILEEDSPISPDVQYKSKEIEVVHESKWTSADSMVCPHHEVVTGKLGLGHNVLKVLANVASPSLV